MRAIFANTSLLGKACVFIAMLPEGDDLTRMSSLSDGMVGLSAKFYVGEGTDTVGEHQHTDVKEWYIKDLEVTVHLENDSSWPWFSVKYW